MGLKNGRLANDGERLLKINESQNAFQGSDSGAHQLSRAVRIRRGCRQRTWRFDTHQDDLGGHDHARVIRRRGRH